MAELNTGEGGGGKHQKKRAKKSSTKVDMTPMVDLAFLLLTFFVLTATFGKPKTMDINMPVDPKDDKNKTKVEDQTAMTLLLTDKKGVIYFYYGVMKADTRLDSTTYASNGLRKILLDKNKKVITQMNDLRAKREKRTIADSTYKQTEQKVKGDRDALYVIVKTNDKTKYKSVVDVMDELNICEVDKKAVIDMSPLDKAALKKINN
ncbi:MAG: biopolymer transporter ExbD [Bacteroidetes bacterium]|nr:biopolymer transporter ExbD [Bacteroidota bacterium]